MGYAFQLARSSGEPVGIPESALERNVTFQVNGVHTASMKVRLGDTLAPELQVGLSRMRVYRDYTTVEVLANPALSGTRQLVFYGYLPAPNMMWDAAGEFIQCVFTDPRAVLQKRFTSPSAPATLETYTATDQGSILWGLVNTQNGRAGGDPWIRQGGTATSTVRTVTYDRRRVSDAFQDMVRFVDGPDIDIDPVDGYATGLGMVMGNLRVYPRQGSDRPNAAFTYGTQLGSNVENIRLAYRDVITQATVVGTDASNGATVTDTYGSPATSAYGLHEDYVSDADKTSLQFVQFRARGIVEALKVPREIITLDRPSLEAPQPFRDYTLGDTIRVHCRKGAMVLNDRKLRVHRIDIKLDQEGDPDITLTTAEQ